MSDELEVVEEAVTSPQPPITYAIPAAPKKRPAAPAGGSLQSEVDKVDLVDGRDIRTWLEGLAGGAAIKVQIVRMKPSVGPHGENIVGTLETVEELCDEDYIRETWGGGTFQLKVSTLNRAGNFTYMKARTVKIAGEPLENGRPIGSSRGNTPTLVQNDDGPTQRAMELVERQADRERERAERLERQEREERDRGRGVDSALLASVTAPLNSLISSLQSQLADMNSRFLEIGARAPARDDFRDRLTEKMLDGESARVETLRAQYENRIEKMRDDHRDDLKRAADRHQAEADRAEARHERELRAAENNVKSLGENSKIAFDARLEAAKAENARLERELTTLTTRLGVLEARKDQSITEKADEIVKVQEALTAIRGDKGDSDPPRWYEKVIDAVGNSEAAVGFINKIAGGGNAAVDQNGNPQQQAPQPQLPPPGVPFRHTDGNVYVLDAAGNASFYDPNQQQRLAQQQRIQRERAKRKKAQATAAGAPAPDVNAEPGDEGVELAEEPAAPQGRPPTDVEMKMAINFMENAIKNGTQPAAFGQTARNLIPTDVLAYLTSIGFEKFLAGAKLEMGSPLATVKGRQFVRQVSQFLVEGAVTPEPTP